MRVHAVVMPHGIYRRPDLLRVDLFRIAVFRQSAIRAECRAVCGTARPNSHTPKGICRKTRKTPRGKGLRGISCCRKTSKNSKNPGEHPDPLQWAIRSRCGRMWEMGGQVGTVAPPGHQNAPAHRRGRLPKALRSAAQSSASIFHARLSTYRLNVSLFLAWIVSCLWLLLALCCAAIQWTKRSDFGGVGSP